jgi:glycosyltransferase involved in cell wall biosynthesis
MTYPLVTIGIPTYNRADGFLRDAIQSALDQSYKNVEIIVSDNCSRDNTSNLVNAFKDSRIQYYRHKVNIGANNNFNFCLNQAGGDFFHLLSDDDLIDPDFVETCISAISKSSNTGIILTGVRIIDEHGHIIREVPNPSEGLSTYNFFKAWYDGKVPYYLCSTLFNTKRLKELGGFKSKTNLYQDVVAGFHLAAKYGRIDVDSVKASFRVHSHNRGLAHKVEAWSEDSIFLIDSLCKLIPGKKNDLKKIGMNALILRCYRRASTIQSTVERFNTYFLVSKKFNHCYSAPRYIFDKKLKPKMQWSYIKNKSKQLFSLL